MENKFTHFDNTGQAIMVDISQKQDTCRTAVAIGKIIVNAEIYTAVSSCSIKKGDVLGIARIAGIMAAKQTSSLIPLCHPLPLTKCSIEFTMLPEIPAIEVTSTVETTGKTGVEMEALTAVQIALLTIYDMCKAIDKNMKITDICLLKKSGGKSGDFVNKTLK